jgi:hypothetical protein
LARKSPPPVSYGDDLALPKTTPAVAPVREAPSKAMPETEHEISGKEKAARRPLLDHSEPTIIYLHPEGKHQLRAYAVAQGLKVKVHDLLIEAVEEWAARRGLQGPFRVRSTKPRRN